LKTQYDCDIAIIGGGLAGLSLSILAAKKGYQVTVFEKGDYPKNKVCGEYISNESRYFLDNLGIDLNSLALPQINKFVLTSNSGFKANCTLETGGFGISRYLLDELLAKKAISLGVTILTNCKVNDIINEENGDKIICNNQDECISKIAVISYGRQTNSNQLNKKKYVGVKYHVNTGPNDNTIEIHRFKGGYCGISKVENNQYCLCYLVEAEKLKLYNNSFESLETAITNENKFLKERFKTTFLKERITTSNLHFGIKDKNTTHVHLGDAAGFIPPVTGNGMSLAFRSANEIWIHLNQFLEGKISKSHLIEKNNQYISHYLNFRIQKGILLQNILLTKIAFIHQTMMFFLSKFPFFLKLLSKQATGKPIR
jgi:flavin-dependent dehydrogenase